jgi:hypothetical protein
MIAREQTEIQNDSDNGSSDGDQGRCITQFIVCRPRLMLAGSWAKAMNLYGFVNRVFGYSHISAVSFFTHHIVETVALRIRRSSGISFAV